MGDLASDVDDFHLQQVFKKYPSCKGAKVVTDQYGYSRYGRGAVRAGRHLCALAAAVSWHIFEFEGTCCNQTYMSCFLFCNFFR